jgi:hypothetical protein
MLPIPFVPDRTMSPVAVTVPVNVGLANGATPVSVLLEILIVLFVRVAVPVAVTAESTPDV